ncbi:MAG: hypothetical protein CM15mP103_12230 [Gammaproteobacteria bacterium]|nr:MAG: hypothetical protein CM15mP103_12230 [Gammaproteobacteria bacterium]
MGGPVALQIPEGDERERHVCQNCGHIHYINPKVIVGCLPRWVTVFCLQARYRAALREMDVPLALWKTARPPRAPLAKLGRRRARPLHPSSIASLMCLTSARCICFIAAASRTMSWCRPRVAGERALYRAGDPWDELAFPTVRSFREFLEDRNRQYPVRNTVIEYPPALAACASLRLADPCATSRRNSTTT